MSPRAGESRSYFALLPYDFFSSNTSPLCICHLALINMDLIDDRAILDEDEDDESFDAETSEVRTKSNGANGRFDDSSEEEDDDDDDEEAAAEVSSYF